MTTRLILLLQISLTTKSRVKSRVDLATRDLARDENNVRNSEPARRAFDKNLHRLRPPDVEQCRPDVQEIPWMH